MKGALLVGVDHYRGDLPPLSGCVADAERLAAALERNDDGSRNFHCETLVSTGDGSLTSEAVAADLHRLLQSEADVALVHFSGHGLDSEIAGGSLVAEDGSELRLSDVVRLMARRRVRQVVLTLDCCFAGDIGADSLVAEAMSMLPDGVAVLAAARGDEEALEDGGGGTFTRYLRAGLAGGAADIRGLVTAAGLYAYIDEAFGVLEQRPVLKASLTRLVELRACEPLVELQVLRQLPELFPTPDADLPLDPSFEDTSEAPDPERVAVFKALQKCARARLVVPVDAAFMYFAAMESRSCRLTMLGRRYWDLANRDLL